MTPKLPPLWVQPRLRHYASLLKKRYLTLWVKDLRKATDALDAARYRWLKRNNDTRFVLWDRKSHDLQLPPGPVFDIDKMIDEQMQTAKLLHIHEETAP
jgi:hypothetical protein